LLAGQDLVGEKEEVKKTLVDIFDGTAAHKCTPKLMKKLNKYLKKEAKRTDFAVTEAEEEAQLKAAAPPQSAAGKDKESEAKDDDGGFEGKQMSSWSAKEVNDWLDAVKELSGFAKMDIKKKFKEIKMDEVLNDDDATGGPKDFNGQDLEWIKLGHLTTPAAWEKTKFVVADKPATTLIEKRDAFRGDTEDAEELQEADSSEQVKKFQDTPMWDWVHAQVRAFFKSMDYKKSVKQAFDASLGDYMVYNEGTGHRLIEGQDFMMTDANIDRLITEVFKGTAASPHAEKVVAAIKEHKASESEEFKKGRKLHKPPPADDVDHPDFDAPDKDL